MKKNIITIFTPTYNRKKTLERLYNSLVNQNYDKFEWLIIDDGSTDNSGNLIKKIKKENKIKITYIYKENGGKMSAVNMAHKICETEYMMTIDSDDMIADNFLKKIEKDLNNITKNADIAGIVYLTAKQNNSKELIGTKLPPNGTICKFYEIYDKYNCKGDKCIVWKTKILKQYYYPIIKGEKFIADAYLMNEISKKYKVMTINTVGTLVEYQEDGYSANYFELVKKNPLGNMLYFRQLYDIKKSLYNVYGYILFGIYGNVKFSKILKEHPNKFLILIMYIPVWIISIIRK